MRSHRIEVGPAAMTMLRRIAPQDQARIRGVIVLLGHDPRPPGAKALRGRPGLRVRVGNYRIIYTIEDEVVLVVAVTIGHRRDVYNHSPTAF